MTGGRTPWSGLFQWVGGAEMGKSGKGVDKT